MKVLGIPLVIHAFGVWPTSHGERVNDSVLVRSVQAGTRSGRRPPLRCQDGDLCGVRSRWCCEEDDRDHLQEIQDILERLEDAEATRSATTSTSSCVSIFARSAARSSSRTRLGVKTPRCSTSARTDRRAAAASLSVSPMSACRSLSPRRLPYRRLRARLPSCLVTGRCWSLLRLAGGIDRVIAPPEALSEGTYRVERVVDGDTLLLANGPACG